jgi:hypothetical protein
MKKFIHSLVVLVTLVIGNSCRYDEVPTINGHITFSLEQKNRSIGGRVNESFIPAAIFLSIKDQKGDYIFENKKIALLAFGQGYVSETLEMTAGSYSISQFLILDNTDKIIYATPLKDSDMAAYVKRPLPISFDVGENSSSQIVPEVVAVLSQDIPENFGYTNFAFEVVITQSVKLKANVKLAVGSILYENVDARITISGYDVNGAKKWNEVFQYTGPVDNELPVKFGFHHYKIETDKWGVHDEQTITSNELWNGRADGLAPVTYVLAGNVTTKKLDYYVESYQLSGLGFEPQMKVQYVYDDVGKMIKYIVYGYNPETASL